MDKKPEPVAWISDDGRPFKSEQEARLNSWNSVSPLYSQQAVDALVAERDALRSERDTAVCFANTAQLLQREAGARALRAEAEAVAFANLRDAVDEWQRRALDAEATIQRLTDEFNAANGPTRMGEPVLPAAQVQPYFVCRKCGHTGTEGPRHLKPDTAEQCNYSASEVIEYAQATHPAADALGAVRELVAKWRDAAEGSTDSPNPTIKAVARCHIELATELESALAKSPAARDEDSIARAIQKARNVAVGAAACHAQGEQHAAGMRRACNIIEAELARLQAALGQGKG